MSKKCDGCGNSLQGKRIYSASNAPRNGFCSSCYKRLPKVVCLECGKKHRTLPRPDFICSTCCRSKRHCVSCGKTTGLTNYYRWKNGVICGKCHYRLTAEVSCIKCSKKLRGNAEWPEGKPVCRECRSEMEKPRLCLHCGNYSLFVDTYPEAGLPEQICLRCRNNARVTCAECLKHRKPAAVNEQGKIICKQCLERSQPFICPECGKAGIPHSKSKCLDCYWRHRLFSQAAGVRALFEREWMPELFESFLQETFERKTAQWTCLRFDYYYRFFVKLDSMFESLESMSAERLLEKFGPDGLRRYAIPVDYLASCKLIRALSQEELVDAARRLSTQRMIKACEGKWYKSLMDGFYANLERLNQRYRNRGWIGEKERYRPMTQAKAVAAAKKFLEYADQCGVRDAGQLHQHVLDGFITEQSGYRHAVRTFIKYLNKHARMFRKLRLDKQAGNINPELFISPRRCAELAAEWTAAQGDDTRNALILMMMLLYAQPAEKIVRLKLSDIFRDEAGKYRILFGSTEIHLEPRISALLTRYLEHRRVLSIMDSPKQNEWLFPGRRLGNHLSPYSVSSILRKYELTADKLFATAILNAYMSGIRHPKVLVRAFGITRVTAMKYLRLIDPRMLDEVEKRIDNHAA